MGIQIISCLKEKEFNSEELELLLPISKSSTELSNKITPSDIKKSNGYDSNKAIKYAKQWWNRTNNKYNFFLHDSFFPSL